MENIQAGAFVIPNGSCVATDLLVNSAKIRTIKLMRDICAQFNMDFDPDNDKLIQMWFHSDELGSDNLEAHGFKYNGNHYDFRYAFLPYKILKDIKEGDELTIKFYCEYAGTYYDDNDPITNESDIWLTMDVKFEQLPYRYRNKGRFEEAVKYVL
jgi:hypothetical protein